MLQIHAENQPEGDRLSFGGSSETGDLRITGLHMLELHCCVSNTFLWYALVWIIFLLTSEGIQNVCSNEKWLLSLL